MLGLKKLLGRWLWFYIVSDECINRCPKKQKMNDISKALKKIYDDLEIKCKILKLFKG